MECMRTLPPLDCLRFFEAAAHHESFTKAAAELCRTQAAVAYRVKTLEAYLGYPLFTRQPRGIRLTSDGRAYLEHIQRIFADIQHVTQHHRSRHGHTLLKVVAVEVVAEQWLMPRLAHFKASHPEIAIELETDHRKVDPTGGTSTFGSRSPIRSRTGWTPRRCSPRRCCPFAVPPSGRRADG